MSEYFRDMGFNVSMMADSTSRWAEALREISGRLAEMPAGKEKTLLFTLTLPPSLQRMVFQLISALGWLLSTREPVVLCVLVILQEKVVLLLWVLLVHLVVTSLTLLLPKHLILYKYVIYLYLSSLSFSLISLPFFSLSLSLQVFWGLDKKLAQRKHFPSINWLLSYSKYMRILDDFYDKNYSEFVQLRTTVREGIRGRRRRRDDGR